MFRLAMEQLRRSNVTEVPWMFLNMGVFVHLDSLVRKKTGYVLTNKNKYKW